MSPREKAQGWQRWPWWLLWLWRPDWALDLNNSHGRADHSKRIGFLCLTFDFGILLVGQAVDRYPPVALFLIANVVGFGWVGMRTLLRSGVLRSTETLNRSVVQETQAIVTRRDPALGAEPAP